MEKDPEKQGETNRSYPSLSQNSSKYRFVANPEKLTQQLKEHSPQLQQNKKHSKYVSETPSSLERSALTGYVTVHRYMNLQGKSAYIASSVTKSNDETVKPPIITPSLTFTEPFDISEGKTTYRVYPFLTQKQAHEVNKTGIVLKTEADKISGFLGCGHYSEVYVAEIIKSTHSPLHSFCAVKIIHSGLKDCVHEADIQLQLTQQIPSNQTQLMPLWDAIKIYEKNTLKRLYCIFPLAALGNLKTLREHLLSLENKELKRLLGWHIAKGLLLGLWQMHRQNIYHLDVKLENILVNNEGTILLSDFGTAEKIEAKPPFLTPYQDANGRFIGNGDSRYFPHERDHPPQGGAYGQAFDAAKVDIYQAGAALWEIVTGKVFPDDTQVAFEHPTLQNSAPHSLANLVLQLIQYDPQERLTLEQALNHPIFQTPTVHDQQTMAVVLDFLKRFVHQVHHQAKEQTLQFSLNELTPSISENQAALNNKLTQIQQPFVGRSDIHEQLQLYLPLQGSLTKKVKDPEKECFDLETKTKAFLNDPNQAVLVLLADGGSGKTLFTQRLSLELLKKPIEVSDVNDNSLTKPMLPLYVSLSTLKQPNNLLQEAFNLLEYELKSLQQTYQLLLIVDGYDEQPRQNWINLYIQNKLNDYNIKLIITCRINALPSYYSSYFAPQVPGEHFARGYQEIYLRPFTFQQIETYVQNYLTIYDKKLQEQVSKSQITAEWVDSKIYLQKFKEMTGLEELVQTPLMCRFVLEALPELTKEHYQSSMIITRTQVYEAFLTRWINQQIHKQIVSIDKESICSIGQKIALQLLRENRSIQINLNIQKFIFHSESGYYQLQPHAWDWFVKAEKARYCLPLQETNKGQFKFLHFSIQEFLLARHLYQQLKVAKELKNLDWNTLTLTQEEQDRPILYFLGDFANNDTSFQQKLFQLVEQTKINKSQARSGANAITVLNAGDIQFNNQDFRNIAIPNANLSGIVACNSDWSNANLTGVNFRGAQLHQAKLINTQLNGIRFYEYPYLVEKAAIHSIYYSRDEKTLVVVTDEYIKLYDAKTHSPIRTINEPTGKIIHAAYSFDEKKTIALVNKDDVIKFWNSDTGHCLQTFYNYKLGYLMGFAFSPNGKSFAIVKGVNIKFYDAINHLPIPTINPLPIPTIDNKQKEFRAHAEVVTSIAYSPDSKYFASGGSVDEIGHVKIWDIASEQCLHTFSNFNTTVTYITYSPDGKTLAVAVDKDIKLYNAFSYQIVKTISGNKNKVMCVIYSPTGGTLAVAKGNTIKTYKTKNYRHIATFRGHEGEVKSISYSPDDRNLASGSADGTVKLWYKDGQCFKTLDKHKNKDKITCIVYSPKGDVLAVAINCIITLYATKNWDCQTRIHVGESLYEEEDVTGLAYSPDGEILVSISKENNRRYSLALMLGNTKPEEGKFYVRMANNNDLEYRVIDPKGKSVTGKIEEKKLAEILEKEEIAQLRVFKPEKLKPFLSKILRITSERGHTHNTGNVIRFWNSRNGKRQPCDNMHGKENRTVQQITYSPDGDTFAMIVNNSLVFYDSRTFYYIKTFHERLDFIAYLPDSNKYFLSPSFSCIQLWDVISEVCLRRFDLMKHPVSRGHFLTFSPDGKQFALYDRCKEKIHTNSKNSNIISLWDFAGELSLSLQIFEEHTDSRRYHERISAVVFSPDGKQLVSGNLDDTIKLWDTTSGQCLQIFEGHHGPVRSIIYSRNGKHLVSGSTDRRVRFWEVTSEPCLRTFGDFGIVTDIAYSPHRKLFAIGCYKSMIKFFNSINGHCVKTLTASHFANDDYTYPLTSIAYSPDGKTLASSAYDRTIKLYTNIGECFLTFISGITEGCQKIDGIAYSPDSKTLASSSSDGTIKLWDIANEQCISHFQIFKIFGKRKVLVGYEFGYEATKKYQRDEYKKHYLNPYFSRSKITCDKEACKHYKIAFQDNTLADNLNKITFCPDGKSLTIPIGCHIGLIKYVDGYSLVTTTNIPEDSAIEPNKLYLYKKDSELEYAAMNKNSTKIERFIIYKEMIEGWNLVLKSYIPENSEINSGFLYLYKKNHGLEYAVFNRSSGKVEHHAISLSAAAEKEIMDTIDQNKELKSSLKCAIFRIALQKNNIPSKLIEYQFNEFKFRYNSNVKYKALEKFIKHKKLITKVHPFDHKIKKDAKLKEREAILRKKITENRLEQIQATERVIFYITSQKGYTKTHFHIEFLSGHTELVTGITYSPDGRTLASRSKDNTIKLWDPVRKKCLQTLTGHKDQIKCITYSPDGNVLISGSDDMTIMLWDVRNGACLQTFAIDFAPQHICLANLGCLLFSDGLSIRCFALSTDYQQLTLNWLQYNRTALVLTKTDITGAQGLSTNNASLFKQHNAIGEPATIVESMTEKEIILSSQKTKKRVKQGEKNTSTFSEKLEEKNTPVHYLQHFLRKLKPKATLTTDQEPEQHIDDGRKQASFFPSLSHAKEDS